MKILLTGAAGFLGRHLARAAVPLGQVIAVSRVDAAGPDACAVECVDLSNPEEVRSVFDHWHPDVVLRARWYATRQRPGVFAESESPQAIASAIRFLADHPEAQAGMAENGRRWVLANAGRDVLAARYLDVLTGMATASGSSTASAETVVGVQEHN